MKIKTAELSGRALDWAVAIVDRQLRDCSQEDLAILIDRQKAYRPVFDYSESWEKCGPLIEKHGAWVSDDDGVYFASCETHMGRYVLQADNPMTAICRAVVASKLGDEVDIPDELMWGA